MKVSHLSQLAGFTDEAPKFGHAQYTTYRVFGQNHYEVIVHISKGLSTHSNQRIRSISPFTNPSLPNLSAKSFQAPAFQAHAKKAVTIADTASASHPVFSSAEVEYSAKDYTTDATCRSPHAYARPERA